MFFVVFFINKKAVFIFKLKIKKKKK